MASFNKVILIGNLTRDPEVRYTPSQTAVVDIGLAVNRTWFDKQTNSRREEVTFVEVTLWGRTAEVAGEYLSKGRPVLIEGRLQLDQWDDRETGQKRSKLKVVGENMTMLGSRGDGQQGGGAASGQNSGSYSDGQNSGGDNYNSGSDSGGGGYSDSPGGSDSGPSPQESQSSPPAQTPNDEVPF